MISLQLCIKYCCPIITTIFDLIFCKETPLKLHHGNKRSCLGSTSSFLNARQGNLIIAFQNTGVAAAHFSTHPNTGA